VIFKNKKSIDSSNPKLATRLRLALLATLLAVLVLATIAAAVTAYLESSDLQDETLLSVAKLVNTNQIDVQTDRSFYKDKDFDEGVQVWKIPSDGRSRFAIKESISNGFYTKGFKGELWRVYVTTAPESQTRYAITQMLSVKTELALRSAINTALPLLGLFLLVPILITLIVRHSFKPLNTLGNKLRGSNSLKLDLSNRDEIPVEVLPFVSSIETLLQKNTDYNKRQQRFIADAAHELRTPITALSLEIENLQKAANSQIREEREQSLQSSISRLQRLINQLLDLARAQSAESENTTPVSLNELLRTQIADLYALAENKDIEFVVASNDDVTVKDINNQLQHMVRNALSNAIKFSPVSSRIVIELQQQNNSAVFSVTDDGPGVDEQHLEKLHEPFYRPVEQSTSSGAGLGLAICHEIAQQLGGRLSLTNVAKGGFRFSYTQPLWQDDHTGN